jgi:hypothetical protein
MPPFAAFPQLARAGWSPGALKVASKWSAYGAHPSQACLAAIAAISGANSDPMRLAHLMSF